jgi:hypothetical protein
VDGDCPAFIGGGATLIAGSAAFIGSRAAAIGGRAAASDGVVTAELRQRAESIIRMLYSCFVADSLLGPSSTMTESKLMLMSIFNPLLYRNYPIPQ